jgi:hypothetical protein
MVTTKYAPITEEDEWFIGSHRILEFQVLNEDGSVRDISGWSIQWMLRQSPDSDAVFMTKATGSGITITDGVNGIFQVVVSAEDTLLITPGAGTYWHSAKRTDADVEDVLVFGEATIQYAATR